MNTGNALVVGAELGSIPAEIVFELRLEEVMDLRRSASEAFVGGVASARVMLGKIDAVLPEIDGITRALRDLRRPATVKEIAQQIGILIRSNPNHSADVTKSFGRILAQDVIAQRPSYGALEAACRRLRLTQKWTIKIPEVIEEIQTATTRLQNAEILVGQLPSVRADIERRLQDVERRERLLARAAVSAGGAPPS